MYVGFAFYFPLEHPSLPIHRVKMYMFCPMLIPIFSRSFLHNLRRNQENPDSISCQSVFANSSLAWHCFMCGRTGLLLDIDPCRSLEAECSDGAKVIILEKWVVED